MICKNCGKEVKDTARFCPNCGLPLPENVRKTERTEILNNENKGLHKTGVKERRASKLPILIILITIVVILSVILGYLILKKKPVEQKLSTSVKTEETNKESSVLNTDSETVMESQMPTESEYQSTIPETETENVIRADIDGVNQTAVSVPGTIGLDGNKLCLILDSYRSIYARNSSGNPQLMNNISFIYLTQGNTAYTYKDYLDWKVMINGRLTVSDGKVFIFTDEITTVEAPAPTPETAISSNNNNYANNTYDYYDSYDPYDYYVIPYSSTSYLSESDLWGLSDYELMIARNEIYARHGRMFDDKELDNYFRSMPWYTPSIKAKDFKDSMLSDLERDNIQLIKKYEGK